MPIKKVRLGPQSADVRVEPQELQQSPGAPLFDPDDQSLGEPPRGCPLFPRAVDLQSGVVDAQRIASVPLLRPSRPPQEDVLRGRLDFRVLRGFRLAASGEKVDQGEADDAQRGGDGESVKQAPQVRLCVFCLRSPSRLFRDEVVVYKSVTPGSGLELRQ
ncbi:hypothetical protein XENOCAPTIV_018963 [Xenoophorus captivus]|uniref:Uncharacterized protein n=1 Tax=Xenoophorus captivus TaxID=1517983 RepID=A0ABV0R429_9TELE